MFKNNQPAKGRKIAAYIFFSFVFLVLVGITFWGVQWFSNSLQGLLIHNSFSPASLQTPIENVSASVREEAPVGGGNLSPARNWGSGNLNLSAQAAISVEIGSGTPKTLFNKNEQMRLPIASLTKLMTAAIILDHYDLSQKVTISPQAMAQEGEQGDLQLGQTFAIKDLLYIMLMESSNRASYALAEYIGTEQFVAAMNAYAQNMGLSGTHFADASGLDSGSYSTAKDLVVLSQYVFERYPLFREIISNKQYALYLDNGALHHTLVNTNELLGKDNVIGGKTGFTKEAQGCVMTIQTSP
ncbi:serine hydrolase, partial [Candidatus Parcubacteria bacterium]|nr:serine hydrolase [Candidatus Parcubacteria bacterium]